MTDTEGISVHLQNADRMRRISDGGFDDRVLSPTTLQAYADHAAVAWDAVQRKAQWRNALASRGFVGQATTMLEEKYGVSSEEAFALLRRLSTQLVIPLADVARRLVSRSVPSQWRAKLDATAADGTAESPTATLGRLPEGLTTQRRRQTIREATRC